jgi:hypothetical protein
MEPELALKAISHTTSAIALLTLLVVLLISLRKELSGAGPLRGIAYFALGVLGVCTFVTLTAGYSLVRKTLPHLNTQSLDIGHAAPGKIIKEVVPGRPE